MAGEKVKAEFKTRIQKYDKNNKLVEVYQGKNELGGKKDEK